MTVVPSAQAILAISMDSSSEAAPSSIPGRICECMSIINGSRCFSGKGFVVYYIECRFSQLWRKSCRNRSSFAQDCCSVCACRRRNLPLRTSSGRAAAGSGISIKDIKDFYQELPDLLKEFAASARELPARPRLSCNASMDTGLGKFARKIRHVSVAAAS